MDVLNPANSRYFCQKCQMYIHISLQPIHSTFCQGVSSQDINQYSDLQVYELSRLMQDYNLLDYQYQDSRINIINQQFNFEDYLPEDANYIEYQPSPTPTSQLCSTNQNQQNQQIQQNSLLQQQQSQIRYNNSNHSNQGHPQNMQNSRYQYFVQDSNISRNSANSTQSIPNSNGTVRNQQISTPQRLGQAISGQYKQGQCIQSGQKQGNGVNFYCGNTPNSNKQGIFNQNQEDNYDESFQCHQCLDYVKYSDYSIHQDECRNQQIKCKYCNSFYPYSLINQHLVFCEQNNHLLSQSSSLRSFRRQQNQMNSPNKHRMNGYDSEEGDETKYNDIDEHNSVDNNNSVYENITQYGTQQFNMEERSLANRYRQNDIRFQSPNSTNYLQTQSSTITHTNNNNNINNTNNTNYSENNNNNNDWTSLSPDHFHNALNIIFPSFVGEQNDFRRQQNELFRNNLITRLINISRFGLSGENNRGLSQAQKSQFIKVQYKQKQQNEYKTCSICMCDFEEDEEINILDCMHRYHVECISKWFQARTTCPICKKDMSEYMQ